MAQGSTRRTSEVMASGHAMSEEPLKKRKQDEKILAKMLNQNRKTAVFASGSASQSATSFNHGLEPEATTVKVKWKRNARVSLKIVYMHCSKAMARSRRCLTGSKGTAATISYGGPNSREAGEAAVSDFGDNSDFRIGNTSEEDKDTIKRAAVFTHDFNTGNSGNKIVRFSRP